MHVIGKDTAGAADLAHEAKKEIQTQYTWHRTHADVYLVVKIPCTELAYTTTRIAEIQGAVAQRVMN